MQTSSEVVTAVTTADELAAVRRRLAELPADSPLDSVRALRATLATERHRLQSRLSYEKRMTTVAGQAKLALLASQESRCAICGGQIELSSSHLDHDHRCCPVPVARACGECFRGLLCAQCNTGLGLFRDDSARLRAGADYLDGFPPRE